MINTILIGRTLTFVQLLSPLTSSVSIASRAFNMDIKDVYPVTDVSVETLASRRRFITNITIFNMCFIFPLFTIFFLIIPKESMSVIESKPILSSIKFSYALIYFSTLIWFNTRYTTLVVDPTQLSKQLQKMAVVIPGIRTGCTTRYFLAEVLNLLTLLSSVVLTILFFIPNIVQTIIDISSFNNLGITSLLIVAGIILDLSREVKSISLSNMFLPDK